MMTDCVNIPKKDGNEDISFKNLSGCGMQM
jgi:hypothetical protein